MENGGAAREHVDMQLALKDHGHLKIGEQELTLRDATAKKASRGTCVPIASSGRASIPFYDILWADIANGTITIDYAARPSQTTIKLEKWVYSLAAAPEGTEESHGSQQQAFVSALMACAYGPAKPEKRAYVLINPSSGPGGAVRKWKADVKPFFDAARVKSDTVILSRGGEATERSEKVDLDKYDTIIACSGDGTPHEIFNGLGRRPDAAKALSRMAVSHVPCGSGNGLACNLYGDWRVSTAVLGIIKGVAMPMDLASVTQGSKRLLSFMSQSLGIVAESDLGTENLRWMGSKRFEVGLMKRVFQKKCYPYDLAAVIEVEKEGVKAKYKQQKTNSSNPAPNGVHDANGTPQNEGLPALKYGTVQDDLPTGWNMVSYDNIGNFYCGNMPYVAPNANFFPAALPSDGCMDLLTVEGKISPIAHTKLLLATETDKFFDLRDVKYQKLSAYRIAPRNQKDGYISIDGERIDFAPFQVEVHRGLGRVISRRGVFEAPGPAGWEQATVVENGAA